MIDQSKQDYCLAEFLLHDCDIVGKKAIRGFKVAKNIQSEDRTRAVTNEIQR